MKSRIIYSVLFIVCFTISMLARQEKYIKHTVTEGETITLIAQKYKVTPFDIYKINPDSKNGIKLNSVLLIPTTPSKQTVAVQQKPTSSPSPVTTPKTHLVQPKETLFSISKQYNVTVDAIKVLNGDLLKDGLKTGQNIKIPSASDVGNVAAVMPAAKPKEVTKETPKKEGPNAVVKEEKKVMMSKEDHNTYHVIQPQETKYAISKKYGISIEELEKLNPEIVSNFPIGYKLLISGDPKLKPAKSESLNSAIEKPKEISNSSGKKYLQEYVVKPKETVSSIAADFGVAESELISLNPELKNGVKTGMILRVPMSQKMDFPKKEQGNLIKSINTNARKQLALLLPFNLAKIESDTVNTTQARLKKDKFLNLTLDFYAGALMAIDSAKVLGLNVDITILDSEETKNSSNVAALVKQHNLEKMDAIIGPFYQANVEKLAELVEPTKTPVISPLSKDSGKKYSNLYQSMPPVELLRSSVFDFMRSKNGNILAVIDPKKGSIKQYIQEVQKDARIVGLSPGGSVVADSLKVLFRKDKINYVVLASESTSMILAITNAMLSAQKEYQVQLVILEQNETLDFEEISLSRLTKLKLLYPSLSRPNESEEASQFDMKYKKLNRIIPDQYAIRGFDVTFDTLMRLSQEKTFEETIRTTKSEQIENKFDYVENTTEGYSNNGIYILYYDTDLNIKEAI